MFVMTGVAHFVPAHAARHDRDRAAAAADAARLLVTVTGVLELLGAVGLLYPPTRVAAAVCLFVLMLVMFPANVYAARMPNPPKSMTSRLDVRTAEEIGLPRPLPSWLALAASSSHAYWNAASFQRS